MAMTLTDGSSRRAPRVAILILATLWFVYLNVRLILDRGPVRFEAPQTVFSNGHVAERLAIPYLLFLDEVGNRLPANSTVAMIGPNSSTGADFEEFLIALGQLPGHRVILLEDARQLEGPGPRFVAAYGKPCEETGPNRPVASLPHGCLYEIAR